VDSLPGYTASQNVQMHVVQLDVFGRTVNKKCLVRETTVWGTG